MMATARGPAALEASDRKGWRPARQGARQASARSAEAPAALAEALEERPAASAGAVEAVDDSRKAEYFAAEEEGAEAAVAGAEAEGAWAAKR